MEKARAKRIRRAEKRKGPAAGATDVTETVKSVAQGATETLGNVVTAAAQAIKQVVVGSSEPTRVPGS
jgi:hypothetical protein